MKKGEKLNKPKSKMNTEKRQKTKNNSDFHDKYLRAFVESSSDIIIILSLEGVMTYVNPAIEKALGFKPEEMTGAKGFECVHPDDMKFIKDSFVVLAADKKSPPIYGEMRLRHKNGSWRIFEAVVSNLVKKDVIEAIMINYRDISERKKAEEDLCKSDERYRTILEDIQDGYFEVDLAGNFTFFNETLCRVSGYSRDELTGMNNRQYTDEEELKTVYQAYHNVYLTGEPHKDLVWKIRTKDGGIRYIEGSISLLKNSSGNPTGFRGIARDITERIEALEALKKSEALYRLLADNISEHVWIMDLNLKLVYISPSVEKIYGYTLDEVKKLSFKKLFTAESQQKILEMFSTELPNAVINAPPVSGTRRVLELQARHKDGHLLWIENRLSFIRDENGKPISILGETRDITERKLAEEKLRDEQQLFRALSDQSSDIIILINKEGAVTYENKSSNILGLKTEERIGASAFELVHPDDLKLVKDSFNILFSDTNAPVQKAELRLRSIDGTWRTFEAIGSNLVHDHIIESAIVNLRDITERKEAENLLKESEERYRLLADHMKDQVWLMDMNMNITYVSPSVERITGYASEEIKKLPWEKLLTPESLKKAVDFTSVEMPRALKAPSNYLLYRTLELEFVLKNGQTLWGECEFSLIRDENGRALSILGEARNITERKLAEEKLQHTLASLKKAVETTIQVLVSALEARDPYTAGHQSRSANLACAIAQEMGLPQDKIEGINMAGIIHDIGKLSIPAEILSKPTKLTNLEFSMIKVHPQSGYEMLKDVESPWPLAQIVHQHHERMNGSGYPQKLKGNEILMEARILAVADVVEAMASHRPYRASLGIDAAIDEIEKNKGILYDGAVVDACLRLFREKNYQLT